MEATCGQFGNNTTVFLRDVSDRKSAEEKLKQSEKSLRLTLETIPGLVYTCTPEGAIEYANEQVSEYLGRSLREVQDGAWDDALHPAERTRVVEERYAHFRSGVAHTTEYRLRSFEGVYKSYQTSVRPLIDGTGRIIRWYGVLTDIEDRRQMEAMRAPSCFPPSVRSLRWIARARRRTGRTTVRQAGMPPPTTIFNYRLFSTTRSTRGVASDAR